MRNQIPTRRVRVLAACLVALVAATSVPTSLATDDSLEHYFEQLRSLGLFSIAESYSVSRLSQSNLPASRRIELTIELSRTLSKHSEFVSEHQQQELWKRAQAAVDDERSRAPTSSFAILLSCQSAIVPANEAEWLRFECELRPFDEALAARTRQQCNKSIELLSAAEHLLTPKERAVRKTPGDGPSSYELNAWMYRVRLALSQTLRNRAELAANGSRERSVDLIDAESTARKLKDAADEFIQIRAKLLMVSCARLKGELNRAEELLEKGFPADGDKLVEEITAERVRVLLDQTQLRDALELTRKLRTSRQRLTGELWFLRTRTLLASRDLAVSRRDTALADDLRKEAQLTLQRCDDQVGGFWSRRCHQLWEATRTAEKYGPELDGLMQQARSDFLAARIEPALKGYARAEVAARAKGQTELACELGYTRASILLNDKQYETAGAEFLRLATEYPQNARAAASHLNGTFCLGRLYDEQKTQTLRERYTAALDQHLNLFSGNPTADDARYLKAQLEEQRLQAKAALPLYLNVAATHPRASEAHAGAARCYETLLLRLRDQKLPSREFEQSAVKSLLPFLPADDQDQLWSAPDCEVALHLAAILLLSEPPRFDRAEPLLQRIVQAAIPIKDDDEQSIRWRRLRQRAETLRVVALAGNGKPIEAERLMTSLASAAPRDLLSIVERLAPFVSSENRQRQVQYVNLQLLAIETLSKHREALSHDELNQLDQSLARAYLASGQITKAVEIYQRQATAAPKDANRQREIAVLLAEHPQRECVVVARQCWRQVESLTKQGSPEWLTARLGVITTGIQLDQAAESRKLLGVTKLLYPELGGAELKSRFLAAEQKLGLGKSPSSR